MSAIVIVSPMYLARVKLIDIVVEASRVNRQLNSRRFLSGNSYICLEPIEPRNLVFVKVSEDRRS